MIPHRWFWEILLGVVIWVLVVFGAVALLGLPASAQSGPNCGPHAVVMARLAELFGEVLVGAGIGGPDGALMEIYAAPDTGTWTIAVTAPGGLTCLVASGTAFELVAPANTDRAG